MANTQPTGRLEWTFQPGDSMNPDNRQARALEYIAHYLDRIEQHLFIIARNSDTDDLIKAISGGLTGVGNQILKAAP